MQVVKFRTPHVIHVSAEEIDAEDPGLYRASEWLQDDVAFNNIFFRRWKWRHHFFTIKTQQSDLKIGFGGHAAAVAQA